MDRNIFLNSIGTFGWDFGSNFFIETKFGNFIWSDPDYNGNNHIKKFYGDLETFCQNSNIPYIRDKGNHVIQDYVGNDVILEF